MGSKTAFRNSSWPTSANVRNGWKATLQHPGVASGKRYPPLMDNLENAELHSVAKSSKIRGQHPLHRHAGNQGGPRRYMGTNRQPAAKFSQAGAHAS